MKITALTENTSNKPHIGCEHGLSLYIETSRHTILFDSGQSDLFSQNAKKLGVDLEQVDFAVLSHGHYDHSGGLKRFLQINRSAPVYLNRHAFEPHFNGSDKDIGVDRSLQTNDRLIYTDEEFEIADGISLFACNTRITSYRIDNAGLRMIKNGALHPDDFSHEHYLLIRENGKRVLISGCSHKGILNIMEWFEPDVLVGGFHFSKRELDEKLAADARTLNRYPTTYYTCHCTGVRQYDFMKKYMERLHYLSTGETITI